MATMKLPKRLNPDTIMQATFELRFNSSDKSAGDLLPGLLKPQLGSKFQNLQPLPASEVPKALRQSDENWTYMPLYVFIATESNESVAIGNRVISYTILRPYPGWHVFKKGILDVVKALKATNMLTNVERYSLKYINVIPSEDKRTQLNLINLKISVGDIKFLDRGFRLRFEQDRDGHTCITTIAPETAVTGPTISKPVSGLLLDVDVINMHTKGFLNPDAEIEETHNIEKEIYFGVLSQSVLQELKPEW